MKRISRVKAYLMGLLHKVWRSSRISSNYVLLRGGEAEAESGRLRAAWQAEVLPQRQRKLVDSQIASYRRGGVIDVFDVMVQALRGIPIDVRGISVLEVGCSSGFYSEVLDIAGTGVVYSGCDYSEAFISLARQKYPTLRFDVEDATALSYERGAFDVVISGCCLLHIPEYEAAVAETARVAGRYAIFHRTPVVLGQPNKYYRKQAYGVETVEIHFNEPQFLGLLAQHGLELMKIWTLSQEGDATHGSSVRTYLCRKVRT